MSFIELKKINKKYENAERNLSVLPAAVNPQLSV